MSLPSYDEIIAILELPTPVVWERDKRTTRSGIRKMLMAAYQPLTYKEPPWLRLWRQIEWVRGQLRFLGISIPPELWAEDKARLGAKIAASTDIVNQTEKERALRWARR